MSYEISVDYVNSSKSMGFTVNSLVVVSSFNRFG
jgi:hypothetical protein